MYVKKAQRPVGGIGPHFDLYKNVVSPEYPFIVTYNIRGRTILRATALSDELHDYYNSHYPIPTEDAKEARRHIGALALMDPRSEVYEGMIYRGTGLVIPQVRGAAPLVHEVEPLDRPPRPIVGSFRSYGIPTADSSVGDFKKFVVPRSTNTAINTVVNEGYKSLAEQNRINAELQRRREEA